MMFLSLLVFFVCFIDRFSSLDLNIYRSVTEIRQCQSGSGSYQYVFLNGEYGNVVDGTVSWEGTPFIRQEIYNTIDSLKGALVNVRQSTSCDCKIIEAKIVEPNSMLLENVETGAFFYADSRSIEYKSKRPENSATTLTFDFKTKKTKFTGTLSYLVRGISWSPSYDLFVTDDNTCSLAAYAVIRNNQQQEYNVDNTYLYSGDLQLVNNYSPLYVQSAPVRSALKAAPADNASNRQIQSEGEERGFYFYSLKTNYKLRPSSSIRLPFIEVESQCRFYYKTSTNIGTGIYKGVFQRNYDVKPNKFLPAGVFTIRDNQILVGQSSLADVPENFTQTIVIGQDNDVRYSIKGNLTASNEDKAKQIWRTYELDVTITNYKSKSIRGQLDFYGAIRTSIDETTCQTAKVDANTIMLPFELSQGEASRCQITVTLRYN